MSDSRVRIVRLPPMRVASFLGFGQQPETEALQKMSAWAQPKGLLDAPKQYRVFGFNNPSPTPASPNYGYEVWMTVGPEVHPEGVQVGDAEIEKFPGGLYAVMRCDVAGDPNEIIPATWKKLALWREDSRYKGANHQWLEEHLHDANVPAGGFSLDLYLPIAE